jgi:hypothetical protein
MLKLKVLIWEEEVKFIAGQVEFLKYPPANFSSQIDLPPVPSPWVKSPP